MAESASAQENTFKVRGGTDENGRYWDTVDTIARAWKRANPDTTMSYREVWEWIVRENNLKTVSGKSCEFGTINYPNIKPDQVLKLPAGNPLGNFPVIYAKDCDDKKPVAVAAAAAPAVVDEVAAAAAPPNAERPLAQFIPQSRGAYRNAIGSDGTNYFLGIPPKDAPADWQGDRGKVKGDAYQPADSEGTLVKQPDKSKLELTRRTTSELKYRPSQTVYIGEDGDPDGKNKRYDQKIEQNARFMVDDEGNIITVVDGNVLVSQNRRLNPYYEGIWREEKQARNLVTQWNNTAEGQMAITTWAGIERQYQIIGDTFFKGESQNVYGDAEKLLQLNVQAALHPLIWSVSSQGVPVGDTSVLRAQAERVLAALPEGEEKARLEQIYRPYLAQLDDPIALDALIRANGGYGTWYNPLMDWAEERSQLKFIKKHYDDVKGMDRDTTTKQERALVVGQRYAHLFWETSVRVPTETEMRFGRGELFDKQAQSEPALREQRLAFLRRMETDPEFRRAVIDTVMSNPGTLQYWTDPLFYATRPGADQGSIMGFDKKGDAKPFVEGVSGQLGGKKYEDDVRYDRLNIAEGLLLRPLGKLVTLGAISPFDNKNQNNGLTGFESATRERWRAGGQSAAEVEEGFRRMAEQARIAEEKGMPVASTSMVLSLSPNLTEDSHKGKFSAEYDRLLAISGGLAKLYYDQMVKGVDSIGKVGAGMEAQLERDVAAGKRTTTETGQFDTTAAAAVKSPEDLARVLATANNPTMVSQADVNKNIVTSMAGASPELFSLLAAMALADETAGVEAAQARLNLQARINSVGERSISGSIGGLVGSSPGSRYEDMIEDAAKAIRAAGNDPAARAAAYAKATERFAEFFAADGEKGASRRAAVAVLSSEIAGDNAASALVAYQYREFAVGDGASYLSGLVADGKITADDRMALLAAQAGKTPEERAAKFSEWQEDYIANQAQRNAGFGLSWVEMIKMALLIYGFVPGGKTPGMNPDIPLNPGTIPNCHGVCGLPPAPPPLNPGGLPGCLTPGCGIGG